MEQNYRNVETVTWPRVFEAGLEILVKLLGHKAPMRI